ncbi:MAG: hypothetical protein ACTSYU_05160 [Promethearchaeota archaeon]
MPDTEEKISIIVECPTCQKTKEIGVPKYLFTNKKMGTLKVQIHTGICCEHNFIAFVAKNGKIRGYESIDMAINISKIEESSIQGKLFMRDILKKYGDYALTTCLHSVLLNVPICFLRKKTEKSKTAEISNLFNEVIPEGFNQNLMQISTIWDIDYRKAKIEGALVISPEGLIANAPWSETPLTFEKEILNRALEILDDSSQTLVVQQELKETFKHAQYIAELILEKEIFEADLVADFKEQFNKTPSEAYLKLLKQMVKYRFKGDTSRIKIRSFSKLKEGLW